MKQFSPQAQALCSEPIAGSQLALVRKRVGRGPNVRASVLAVLVGFSSACHKQEDAATELAEAADAIARMELAPANPGAEPPETASTAPAQQVQQALQEYKAGHIEEAVTRLQLLRSGPVLSPQQRMALQDSIAAVMTELYTRAEQGDPRARAAVARYEQMQTRR